MRQMIMRQVSEMRVKGNLSHSLELCCSVQRSLCDPQALKTEAYCRRKTHQRFGMKKYITYLNF